jgi:hypothetical protein
LHDNIGYVRLIFYSSSNYKSGSGVPDDDDGGDDDGGDDSGGEEPESEPEPDDGDGGDGGNVDAT